MHVGPRHGQVDRQDLVVWLTGPGASLRPANAKSRISRIPGLVGCTSWIPAGTAWPWLFEACLSRLESGTALMQV